MADLSDVLNTLVGVVSGLVYPNGTSQPSIANVPVLIYPGWPDAGTLDAHLLNLNNGNPAGRLHLSIYPRPGDETVTTRYRDGWQPLTSIAPTLTLTQAGQQITVGGTVSTPQNLAIVTPKAAYLYAVQGTDTLTSIAAAVAALIPGASSSGAVITVPALTTVTAARVGASGTLFREHKRQRRLFQLSIWANSDANRSALAGPLDQALAALEFITLPDGTAGRLLYRSSPEFDTREQVNLYRRDLMYSVEYATIQTTAATQVVVTQDNLAAILPDGTAPVVITTYQ